MADYQLGFATRLRKSPYYIVQTTKSTGMCGWFVFTMDSFKSNKLELPRYSDKYRPSVEAQPTLKRKDLNEAFFPPAIFDMYFNPKKKRKGVHISLLVLTGLAHGWR